MEPVVKNLSDDANALYFTLQGVEVSLANALRRTILSDIPTVVIETDTYEKNQCNIITNTGRLHNEILKQRLSCIPIHSTVLRDTEDEKALPGNYQLVVDVKNETDNNIYVTTEDFKLRDKKTGTMLSKEEQEKLFPGLFPKNVQTQSYIDFARLRPGIGNDIPGEQISLVSDFSVNIAKSNSMYNVVSKCAYGNTPDKEKAATIWDKQEASLRQSGESESDIKMLKENFRILDAQRQYIPNSFDFVIESVGVYDNRDIIRKACAVLQNKFIDIVQMIDSGVLSVLTSETSMDHCYDIKLEEEDYTIGKVLEYLLYSKFYEKQETLSFCGFKKFHPHDTNSTIRVAFKEKQEKSVVGTLLREVCVDAQQVFKDIYGMFK
jgi:DNA-directed RNA polymerase II subunit RPB3